MEYEKVQENRSPSNLATANKQPELVEALNQFKNQNDYTADVCGSIKERLRNLLNWEKPNDREMDKTPDVIINSAIDEFKYQLKRQRDLNDRLSDILSHIKEIV